MVKTQFTLNFQTTGQKESSIDFDLREQIQWLTRTWNSFCSFSCVKEKKECSFGQSDPTFLLSFIFVSRQHFIPQESWTSKRKREVKESDNRSPLGSYKESKMTKWSIKVIRTASTERKNQTRSIMSSGRECVWEAEGRKSQEVEKGSRRFYSNCYSITGQKERDCSQYTHTHIVINDHSSFKVDCFLVFGFALTLLSCQRETEYSECVHPVVMDEMEFLLLRFPLLLPLPLMFPLTSTNSQLLMCCNRSRTTRRRITCIPFRLTCPTTVVCLLLLSTEERPSSDKYSKPWSLLTSS